MKVHKAPIRFLIMWIKDIVNQEFVPLIAPPPPPHLVRVYCSELVGDILKSKKVFTWKVRTLYLYLIKKGHIFTQFWSLNKYRKA